MSHEECEWFQQYQTHCVMSSDSYATNEHILRPDGICCVSAAQQQIDARYLEAENNAIPSTPTEEEPKPRAQQPHPPLRRGTRAEVEGKETGGS